MDVTAAVFIKDNKVLLMRRGQGHSSAGGWEYPGGKIEPGETGEACIKRELSEELKIDAEIGSMLAETIRTVGEREIHLMAYQVVSFTGEIQLTDHDAMEWVPMDELLEHDQLPSDIEISKQIVKRSGLNPKR